MFGFEIKKILSRLFFITFGTLFSLFVLITCIEISSEYSYKQIYEEKVISELYDRFRRNPDIIMEEYDALIAQIELIIPTENNADAVQALTDDYRIYTKLIQDAKRKQQYFEETSSVIRQAEYHLLAYDKEGIPKTSYIYKYQSIIDSLFSKAQTSIAFGFEHYSGWDTYFNDHNFNAVIYILLIGYLIIHFYNDKRYGNDRLIYPTKNGKSKYIIIKYLTHSVVMFVFITVCEISRICIIHLYHGLSSPLNNIQVFSCFTMNPYNMIIVQYLLLYIGVKLLTALFMFSIGLLICLVCRQIPIIIAVYIGSISITALFHTFTDGAFGPNGLFEVHTFLQRYRSVNLFGYVVYAPLFYFGLCIIGIATGIIFLLCFYHEQNNFTQKKIFSFKKWKCGFNTTRSASHVCLVFHESYKQIINSRKWLILLLVLILISYIQWNECDEENTYTESLYREHIGMVEGIYTVEKENYIKQQYISMLDILSKEGEMREKYKNNLISLEEYRKYINSFTSASTTQYIYLDLLNKTESLKEYQKESGNSGYYIYEKGYHIFNTSDSITLYIVLLIVFCGTSFLPEYVAKNNAMPMIALIRSTKTGIKNLNRTKYGVLLTTNLSLYTIIFIWRLIIIERIYPLKFILSDIHYLSGFEKIPFGISILSYYLLFFMYTVFVISALTAIMLALAKKCKKELLLVIILLVVILPVLLNNLITSNVLSIFDLSLLIKAYHFTELLQGNIFSIISLFIVFFVGILAIVCLCKTYQPNINKRRSTNYEK